MIPTLKYYAILILLLAIKISAQDITNTLAPNGNFKIKDGSAEYLTLSQSTGFLSLNHGLVLPNTTSTGLGVLYMGESYFLHNYGAESTFLGINSGNFNITGIGFNTAVGGFSLNVNTTGYYNSAFGNYSLRSNTSGYRNSAVGYTSLYSNTSGYQNTAVGNQALFSNTSGYYNTAVGDAALGSNTDGNNNTAFGYQALKNNTRTVQNAAFGVNALYNNQGAWNDAFGNFSLYSNTTGVENSAFGHSSLYSNTTGYYNSAFGFNAGSNNTTGGQNSAFGHRSLYFHTTGYSNSAFGYNAGTNITTGNNNTAIGHDAQVPSGTADSQVRIGNTYVTYAGIQVAWTITSDRRWKENIKPVPLGLDFISELNPVSYTRKNDENHRTEYGLIAQEIEEVMNKYGIENAGILTITEKGMYELRYNDLLAPMIKAIQELSIKNEELTIKNANLEERLAKYEELQSILVKRLENLELNEQNFKVQIVNAENSNQ